MSQRRLPPGRRNSRSIVGRSPVQLVQSILGTFGARLVRTANHKTLMDFLVARRADLVVDVGANEGQFGASLRKAGYSGRILSFEPLVGPFARLAAAARLEPPWEVENIGLGEVDGETDMNVSETSVYSSLRTLAETSARFPGAETVGQEKIRLRPLDQALAGRDLGRPFLKLDTQGFEREVLLGARETLARFLGVVMELPIGHLYQGVWNIEEAIGFMRSRGFVLSNFIPVGFEGIDVFEVDCVFRNTGLTREGRRGS